MSQKYAQSFYNSKAWRDTQAAYMSGRYYICERCGDVARIVHHVKHISPQNIADKSITLDWDNLEALCIDCHNAEHFGGAVIANGLCFDENGDVVQLQR
jgi:5-methylcytosine-specific restriction endonuclease McrA